MRDTLQVRDIGHVARLGQGDGRTYEDGTVKVAGQMQEIAALLANPDVRQQIGSAWPLYMLLMLQWNGATTGTRDEIGKQLVEDGRNVGNWVNALERAEIVTVTRLGRRMSVALTGDHLRVAQSRDRFVTQQLTVPVEPVLDDHQKTVLRLIHEAKDLGGTIEIRVVLN